MLTSQQLLEEYIQLWEEKRGTGMVHTQEKWDERAEDWGKNEKNNPITRRRIDEALKFLNQHNLLENDSDIIDVGCGPCCFVAEFAKTAHHVTGTDLSPRMLEFGAEYCHELGCYNTSFVPCDFKTVSVKDMGWEHRFDLVFSSMTPATSEFRCLESMIEMSRGWCCNATCIIGSGRMEEEISRILGDDIVHPAWDGRWFHAMNSLVWLLGYFPETSYYKIQYQSQRKLTLDSVEEELHVLCREKMPDKTKVEEVYERLLEHTDNGIFQEERNDWYGFILWDTRIKTARW